MIVRSSKRAVFELVYGPNRRRRRCRCCLRSKNEQLTGRQVGVSRAGPSTTVTLIYIGLAVGWGRSSAAHVINAMAVAVWRLVLLLVAFDDDKRARSWHCRHRWFPMFLVIGPGGLQGSVKWGSSQSSDVHFQRYSRNAERGLAELATGQSKVRTKMFHIHSISLTIDQMVHAKECQCKRLLNTNSASMDDCWKMR